MSLPDAASLERFSVAELRAVVGALVAEIEALQSRTEAQQATISVLRTENQALRDEVARLKGLPPRPPSRPSGMEQATQPGAADKDAKCPNLPRNVKCDQDAVTSEIVVKAAVPAGSRFKGYEDILVRDLHVSAEVIRYRRERWLLPSGETVLAGLPAGIVGGFGPELRRLVLALHAQGQVTTELGRPLVPFPPTVWLGTRDGAAFVRRVCRGAHPRLRRDPAGRPRRRQCLYPQVQGRQQPSRLPRERARLVCMVCVARYAWPALPTGLIPGCGRIPGRRAQAKAVAERRRSAARFDPLPAIHCQMPHPLGRGTRGRNRRWHAPLSSRRR